MSAYLNANEFQYIQPIAVEEAPVKKVVEPKVKEIVKVKPPVQEIKEQETVEQVILDEDKDGVVDAQDQCPDTSKDFRVNEVGCPKTATLKINFAHNSYEIPNELIEDLERFAKFLEENVGYQVIIYGHTDNTGTEVYNESLSQNRANSVKNALIDRGINKIRLTEIGKSELEPITDNETEEGRATNRRIEVELLQ